MLSNKKNVSHIFNVFLSFVILYAIILNSPVQAQTNDIVVGVGNKGNVTVQILGSTTPTPTSIIIIDHECGLLRDGICRSSCLTNENQIQAGCYPAGTVCCKTLTSPTPYPSGFCTSDNQCFQSQKCDLFSNRCIWFDCPFPPACKLFTATNHQCQLLNRADGSSCVDIYNNHSSCQSGVCLVLYTPTPAPTSITPTPTPCINSTPVPTSAQSPGCTSDAMCRGDQRCELTTHTCFDVGGPAPPICKNAFICNHQYQLRDLPNGSFCINANNDYGNCQSGNCIVDITPTAPTGCSSDSQCRFDEKCDLSSRSCIHFDCPAPPSCKSWTLNNHQCQLNNLPDGTNCIDFENRNSTCQNGYCIPACPVLTAPACNTNSKLLWVTPVPPNQCGHYICGPTFTPAPTGSNDIVVNIGNKQRVTIQIQGSISPTPVISSPPPSGCTSDSQCRNDEHCDLTSRSCVHFDCPQPPTCKQFIINNHQCQLINAPDGSYCGVYGVCNNGQCLVHSPHPLLTPTPTGIISPPTATLTPILITRPPINPTITLAPSPRTTGVVTKLTLNPVADATVDERRPDMNFGRLPILTVDGDFVKQVFMKFDIASLVGKQIVSAKLNLRVANFAQGIQNIRFVDDSAWVEDKITYNTRPATGEIIGKITNTGQMFGRYVNIILDKAGIITSDKNLTVEIESPDKWPFHLFSKDSNFRPQLIVEYVK